MTRGARLCCAAAALLALASLGSAEQPEPRPEPTADSPVERVRSLLASDDWRAALAEARRGHAAAPDDLPTTAALGEVLFRAGRFVEAEQILETLLESESPPARALLTLGRLRNAQGRQAESSAFISRALAAAPDDRKVIYWSAESAATRAETVKRYRRYLELSEGDDPDRIAATRQSIDMLEALGERPIWVTTESPDRVELPLTRLWDTQTGQIQGFVVKVKLGRKRKPVSLLLDSGSPGLFVIQRIAKKCGFQQLAEVTAFGGGGDRKHTTRRGFFSSLDVGGLRFSDVLASTNRQELDPTGRFHGLLGLGAFEGYRVTLDLKELRLVLERSDAELDGAPYWKIEGQMLVSVDVGAGTDGLFLFDTGATRTMLDLTLAESLEGARLGRPVSIHAFGGLLEGARSLHGVQIAFEGASTGGDHELRANDLSTRSRLGGVEISGFLGLDVLDVDRIVVDTVHRRVALSGD